MIKCKCIIEGNDILFLCPRCETACALAELQHPREVRDSIEGEPDYWETLFDDIEAGIIAGLLSAPFFVTDSFAS